MEPIVRKGKLHELDRSDRSFWQTKSLIERFRAVELISNPSLEDNEAIKQEFSRVLKVTHRKRS